MLSHTNAIAAPDKALIPTMHPACHTLVSAGQAPLYPRIIFILILLPIDFCRTAAPDALALHSTLIACASCARNWEPFAFRLVRACVVMYSPHQIAAADKFSNQMRLHALTRADVASASCMNAIVHAAPVESTMQALASATSPASNAHALKWTCSCCCYAAEYARPFQGMCV